VSYATVAAQRTIVFSESTAGTMFYVNGKRFDPNRVDVQSQLNTVEEWTVRNDARYNNPKHQRSNH
jgi:suppressor of ftsI